MLVVNRQLYQTILIDPRTCPVNELGLIEVKVTEIRRGRVDLGITAHRAVKILRGELVEKAAEARESA